MIPVEKLIKGDFQSNLQFLKWLKVFYTANVKSKEYNPVKARNSRDIRPIVASPQSRKYIFFPTLAIVFQSTHLQFLCTNHFSLFLSGSSKLEPDTEENGSETTKKFPYTEKWKDTFEWAECSTLGEHYTYCLICTRNLSTFHKGFLELQRHAATKKHKKRAKIQQHQSSEPLPCSDAAIRFIHKHCYTGSAKQVPRHFARCKLGLQYPKDITSVCQKTPYCVYIYEGVTVGKDDTVSVVLVGFFDVVTSRYCIRFLDALESVDNTGDQTASTVAETMNKFGLPTNNLVAVYCDNNGEASEQICSQLRELNPNIVALRGLYTIADAAFRAGMKQLSDQAQELMADIHAYHSSGPTKNDNLSALFGSDITVDSPSYTYFSSCDKDDDKAKLIGSQLQDPKVRATFMFLQQALKPLQTFQRHLQTQEEAPRADLLLILEKASNLLCTYTSYFLRPQAAARFLKEHDAEILKNKKFHLSSPELNLGGKAVEDFLNESGTAEALQLLKEQVLSFYIALTACIAEELPLSDGVLRSIAQLLNPQSRLKVTGKAVGELGTKLGLCNSPKEASQLSSEFLEYQLAEEGENEEGEKEKSVSVEKHWASVLKDTKPTSVFKKLVLTLLSLPCPPLDAQQVFTQVCKWRSCLNICYMFLCLIFEFLITFLHLAVFPVSGL